MSNPARYEIEKFANNAFAVAHQRIVIEHEEKQNQVLGQVRLRGNSGGYLPALVKLKADDVRDTILALADAYVDAFTLYGVPSDAKAESDLRTSSLQIAAGTISGIRGQLDLMSKRTRSPLNDGAGYIGREIEKSRVSALAEGKLKLERQRIKTVTASTATEAIQQRHAIRAATTAGLETAASTRASGGKSGKAELEHRGGARRLRPTIVSPIAARRMETYMESKGLGQTEFAGKVQTTDRTLRTFRKTGRVRRDIFDAIAREMGTNREALLKPE